NDVGLLTALPALTAFALAIPLGRWLQGRRNIVPWYSRMRLLAWLSYALIAGVAAVLPREQAIPSILAIWGLASLPSTAGLVAFPIVMGGAAGRDGRFDLLGERDRDRRRGARDRPAPAQEVEPPVAGRSRAPR